MTVASITVATRDMLMLSLLLVSPFLAAVILTSIVVGIFQASTRINDMTLSFVPRFAAAMLVLYFTSSWAVGHLAVALERALLALRSFTG